MIKQMYKYVRKPKTVPYVMAVSQQKPMENLPMGIHVTDYLCCFMTNKQFTSVHSCIEVISQNQLTYKKSVVNSIETGTKYLDEIICEYQKKLFQLELCVSDMNASRPKVNIDPVDKLQNMITNRLDQEKNKLIKMELSIMNFMMKIFQDELVIKTLEILDDRKAGHKLSLNSVVSLISATQTLPETLPETEPKTLPETEPKTLPETLPEIDLKTLPEIDLKTLPEIDLKTLPEIDMETLPETEPNIPDKKIENKNHDIKENDPILNNTTDIQHGNIQ